MRRSAAVNLALTSGRLRAGISVGTVVAFLIGVRYSILGFWTSGNGKKAGFTLQVREWLYLCTESIIIENNYTSIERSFLTQEMPNLNFSGLGNLRTTKNGLFLSSQTAKPTEFSEGKTDPVGKMTDY